VETPLLLQFSIALFTGMVAATLVPPVRRSIPRPIEMAMWAVLVVVCVVGISSITSPHARELTASVFWGLDHFLTTLAALLGAGLTGWLVEHRFTIATWLTIVCGADIMALGLLRSHRKSRGWQPRIRLYEWMELPRPTPAPEAIFVPYAIDELNREWAAAAAVAGAALLAWSVDFLAWAREVLVPRAARRLAPAVRSLAGSATVVVRSMGNGRGVEGGPALASSRHEVEIHVLVSALSLGWSGLTWPVSTFRAAEEEDEEDSQQTGRLAS
jgi:hypothetical protein